VNRASTAAAHQNAELINYRWEILSVNLVLLAAEPDGANNQKTSNSQTVLGFS